jgi:hypothetical protein
MEKLAYFEESIFNHRLLWKDPIRNGFKKEPVHTAAHR